MLRAEMMMVDDFDAVLGAAKRGDAAAVGALWDAWNYRLVRFLWARAGDAAEDVASETWLAVAQNLRGFDGGELEFRAWLFTIARRRLIDWQRRARVRPSIAENLDRCEAAGPDDPEREALDRLDTFGALALIGRLPGDQAEVVLLRVLSGLDVARVAQIVGKKPGTVRMLQLRGLRRLRELSQVAAHDGQGVTR
jgi:RNA polymerase sigma-70 factor (ECF subfamily)